MRFNITPFENVSGTKSFRVTGTKRDGARVRENFAAEREANLRRVELETEFLQGRTEASLRTTKLSESQVSIAETAFARLTLETELLSAVEYWIKHGRDNAVTDSPSLDDAIIQFKAWLDSSDCTLRPKSRIGYKQVTTVFAMAQTSLRIADITTEQIEQFLASLKVKVATKIFYKKNLSGFFSWCAARPRRWLKNNPCLLITLDRGEQAMPEVLSIEACQKLLAHAEQAGFAPYVALCLFGGLRPTEATRVTWNSINLTDREIRLDATQTKTRRSRTVAICDTLLAWLIAYQNEPITLPNQERKLTALHESVTDKWVPDIMRHTAISHYFRRCSSYGKTAEQMGNSEAVIKAHYQGRVTSADTDKFYALRPSNKIIARIAA